MCGIIASFSSNKFNQAEKIQNLKMLGSLEKRGPDASNFISQNHVFLGHTRLSIIDTRSFLINLFQMLRADIPSYLMVKYIIIKI